jgi:hypothetical protein
VRKLRYRATTVLVAAALFVLGALPAWASDNNNGDSTLVVLLVHGNGDGDNGDCDDEDSSDDNCDNENNGDRNGKHDKDKDNGKHDEDNGRNGHNGGDNDNGGDNGLLGGLLSSIL